MNLTQESLAEAAGVSRSTVRDFECHRHELHRSTEAQLVRALEGMGVRLIAPGREGPGVRLAGRRGNEPGDPGAARPADPEGVLA